MTKTADWVRQPDGSYKKGKKTILKISKTARKRWEFNGAQFLNLYDAKNAADPGSVPVRVTPPVLLDVTVSIKYSCNGKEVIAEADSTYLHAENDSYYGCSCCSSSSGKLDITISQCEVCGSPHGFDAGYHL